ncbi:NDP-hexose 2,3-dehydratase family protein [Nonomuraea sp. SYSU D8015]|uniref:NDP-hexose 2,3-dehydratase family protein n=1 Tax=Nonomuraea sp. SYSU D8015 TaxID=2593644 RepID=UPI001660179C|nr:NDP-hexose 2,3-dehydratase family protein [Nonomuraea sp. SYSU D8015]
MTSVFDGRFHEWWADVRRSDRFEVTPIPFSEMPQWRFRSDTGNLAHESSRFFSIEGVHVHDRNGATWSQPIINQPEIGILGILVKEVDGVLHGLMQAKFEPGNVNLRQLSPTVQATRSNYTRVHGGNDTPYTEYFRKAGRDRILVDVLQSEQGSWFWRKRNRNIVVMVDGDVPVREGYRWLPLDQVWALLHQDNMVNMDTRTVLACLPVDPPPPPAGADSFQHALHRSYQHGLWESRDGAVNPTQKIVSWFTEGKSRCEWNTAIIPLSQVEGWSRTGEEIVDDGRQDFRILGVRVVAKDREVTRWAQPLLATRAHGLAVLLARDIGGVLHFLLQCMPEPGLLDVVEMGPTVQLAPTEKAAAEAAGQPFVDAVVAGTMGRVRFDALLSEEGGRFYHVQTRYQIVEVGDDFPAEVPENYCWVTVRQLMELLRHGHYLNIQARSLLACIHALR